MKAPACPFCSKGRLRPTPWYRTLSCDACRVGTADLHGPAFIGCCVPFCRAARGDRKGDPLSAHMEWICSRHWQSVSKRLKRRRSKLRRLLARTNDPARRLRINEADNRAWAACKREAIEAAGGIG
ncbi:hypothetical protein [Ancylobacter defluvii]|uniref:Uncharacterized protein n=1 Tax=Ancylobacter defluvii TaxID=1282440 RepID=A0A9W6K358_9HYPH|nr:hypothetical protein [Ancylobacter defluvii]GLK86629.1 hypothetical protein GCM10017653_46990 [Ancylobacter defluvii]